MILRSSSTTASTMPWRFCSSTWWSRRACPGMTSWTTTWRTEACLRRSIGSISLAETLLATTWGLGRLLSKMCLLFAAIFFILSTILDKYSPHVEGHVRGLGRAQRRRHGLPHKVREALYTMLYCTPVLYSPHVLYCTTSPGERREAALYCTVHLFCTVHLYFTVLPH